MQLPPHPVWFWLILASPFLIWLTLWVVAKSPKVSLRPLTPWLGAGYILLAIPNMLVYFGPTGGNKALRLAVWAAFWTCFVTFFWVRGLYMSETLRSPNAKWYSPWKAAEFSVPAPSLRIVVRDVDAVSPWYIEKLGLRKLAEPPPVEPSAAIFRFKADGKSVILTTRSGLQNAKRPMLFTKKIARMKDIMSERGVDVGAIEQDRQGTRYFQLHDPEGNAIEVVEDR
jgi:predicted enzyme related to lactoylglutathione lyase